MKNWYRTILADFLSVVVALIGVLTSGSALGAAPRANTPPPRDSAQYQEWLTKQVRHRLVLLPFYSVFDNLEYRIAGDKVVLLGQVVRPSLRSDAESAVKRIEGVQAVENRIEVLPLSPNDSRIRRVEFRTIYRTASLQRYAQGAVPPIHIIVKNGNVTLEGAVANEGDRNLANIRANGVSGVFSVTNNLRVDSAS